MQLLEGHGKTSVAWHCICSMCGRTDSRCPDTWAYASHIRLQYGSVCGYLIAIDLWIAWVYESGKSICCSQKRVFISTVVPPAFPMRGKVAPSTSNGLKASSAPLSCPLYLCEVQLDACQHADTFPWWALNSQYHHLSQIIQIQLLSSYQNPIWINVCLNKADIQDCFFRNC